MKKVENECIQCDLPCLGSRCPNRNVIRFYCDQCKEEEMLYHFDDLELCADCILKRLNVVEGSEIV